MKPPVIVSYQCDSADGDFPDSMNFAAAMVPRRLPGGATEPGTSWMATGRTEEEARAKLVQMWAREHPDTSNRGAHLRKPKPPETVDADEIIL